MKKVSLVISIFFLAIGIAFLVAGIHMVATGFLFLFYGICILCINLIRWKRPNASLAVWILQGFLSVSAIFLVTCMSLITDGGIQDAVIPENTEYAIVLGASVNTDSNPSRILRERIQKAYDFYLSHPQVKLILTGGQGTDEPVAEAECMYDQLIQMGADPHRLILETESRTTMENFRNCLKVLQKAGKADQPVAVISSEYHLSRALYIARGEGLTVYGIPVPTDLWFYRINYTLREVAGYVKVFLGISSTMAIS